MARTTPLPDGDAARGRVRAIALMLTALVLFAGLDATAKYLVTREGLGVAQVAWLRFLGQITYMVAIYLGLRLPALVATAQPKAQIVRSTLMLGTTGFNFLALKYLRLDQTITIVFLTPLVVAALAGPLLGEWVGWRRWLAILVGFSGIVVAMRPGFATVHPAVLWSLASMLCYAGFMLITRRIAGNDPPFVTLFWSMLVGAVGLAPFALHEWVQPQSAFAVLLLMALGALGGTGHYLFIHAYRLAPASRIAPFLYFQLIAMVALGWLVFADVPDLWTLLGASIVTASGIYLFHRERVTRGGG